MLVSFFIIFHGHSSTDCKPCSPLHSCLSLTFHFSKGENENITPSQGYAKVAPNIVLPCIDSLRFYTMHLIHIHPLFQNPSLLFYPLNSVSFSFLKNPSGTVCTILTLLDVWLSPEGGLPTRDTLLQKTPSSSLSSYHLPITT